MEGSVFLSGSRFPSRTGGHVPLVRHSSFPTVPSDRGVVCPCPSCEGYERRVRVTGRPELDLRLGLDLGRSLPCLGASTTGVSDPKSPWFLPSLFTSAYPSPESLMRTSVAHTPVLLKQDCPYISTSPPQAVTECTYILSLCV